MYIMLGLIFAILILLSGLQHRFGMIFTIIPFFTCIIISIILQGFMGERLLEVKGSVLDKLDNSIYEVKYLNDTFYIDGKNCSDVNENIQYSFKVLEPSKYKKKNDIEIISNKIDLRIPDNKKYYICKEITSITP